MEVLVTTGGISRAKLRSNRHHQQTDTQFFTGRMPFLSPNQQCQSTEGKNITSHELAYPKVTWGLSTLSLTTNSWLPWGWMTAGNTYLINSEWEKCEMRVWDEMRWYVRLVIHRNLTLLTSWFKGSDVSTKAGTTWLACGSNFAQMPFPVSAADSYGCNGGWTQARLAHVHCLNLWATTAVLGIFIVC